MINRRDFFKRSSLIALGGLMAGKLSAAESMSNAMPSVAETAGKKKIGLQIYSLFNELYEGDLDANLKKLAQSFESIIFALKRNHHRVCRYESVQCKNSE